MTPPAARIRRPRLEAVDPKTVRHHAAKREAGILVEAPVTRLKLVDPFLPNIEEAVDASEGGVRADVLRERLVAMGSPGRGGPLGERSLRQLRRS